MNPIWQLIFINQNTKKKTKKNEPKSDRNRNEHAQIEVLEGSTVLTAQSVDINIKLVIIRLNKDPDMKRCGEEKGFFVFLLTKGKATNRLFILLVL